MFTLLKQFITESFQFSTTDNPEQEIISLIKHHSKGMLTTNDIIDHLDIIFNIDPRAGEELILTMIAKRTLSYVIPGIVKLTH